MSPESKPRVLMVDDEPNVLAGFRRALGRRYALTTAEGGMHALTILDSHDPFPVIVTDMRMPGMDGLAFLHEVHLRHPDAVCMMLTGNADQATAVRAINEGRIFRFLAKPCTPDVLDQALQAAHRQHELVVAERVLIRGTLSGSVRLLIEVLALSEPELARAAMSIRKTVSALTQELGLETEWRYPLSASLCLLGTVVEGGATRDEWLDDERLESCAHTAARLLRNIPRLTDVADIIDRQRETGPLPDSLNTADPRERVIIGARLLRIATDLERFRTEDASWDGIQTRLRQAGHDDRIIQAAHRARIADTNTPGTGGSDQKGSPALQQALTPWELRPGMVLARDVSTPDAKLLLSKGRELTPVVIEKLRSLAKRNVIGGLIEVQAADHDPATPEAPEAEGTHVDPAAIANARNRSEGTPTHER